MIILPNHTQTHTHAYTCIHRHRECTHFCKQLFLFRLPLQIRWCFVFVFVLQLLLFKSTKTNINCSDYSQILEPIVLLVHLTAVCKLKFLCEIKNFSISMKIIIILFCLIIFLLHLQILIGFWRERSTWRLSFLRFYPNFYLNALKVTR